MREPYLDPVLEVGDVVTSTRQVQKILFLDLPEFFQAAGRSHEETIGFLVSEQIVVEAVDHLVQVRDDVLVDGSQPLFILGGDLEVTLSLV
jgi:hypothetical protein